MAALILDERCFILACLILVRANENGTGYFWDQCCHLHGDGASLFQNFCLILVSLILTISTLNRISALNRRSIESQMLLLISTFVEQLLLDLSSNPFRVKKKIRGFLKHLARTNNDFCLTDIFVEEQQPYLAVSIVQ